MIFEVEVMFFEGKVFYDGFDVIFVLYFYGDYIDLGFVVMIL